MPKPTIGDWRSGGHINFSLQDINTNTNLFITEQSKSTPSEDMAETFSHIMTLSPKKLKEINDADNILKNKVEFIKYRLLKIYKDCKFSEEL